jgi:hypothetical protein
MVFKLASAARESALPRGDKKMVSEVCFKLSEDHLKAHKTNSDAIQAATKTAQAEKTQYTQPILEAGPALMPDDTDTRLLFWGSVTTDITQIRIFIGLSWA